MKLREEWRGTKGGSYIYVREGNVLRHISKYAVKQMKVSESRKGPTIEYEVPIDRIGEKEIYLLEFTNSGFFCPKAGRIDAFIHSKYPEAPWIPNYDRMRDVGPEELRRLEIEIENASLRRMIQELKIDYAYMINEIKEYSKLLNFEILFMGHARRTADILHDLDWGLFACLSIPDDEARIRSLETPMKWIHQLWVMKLACEGLAMTKIEEGKWCIEQGMPYPAFVASNSDVYSFWFEFQPSLGAHLLGIFAGKRVPIRPDIVICKGKFKDAKELGKIDLIVECKNKDFNFWQEEVEMQLIPYFEKYKPANMILASMKQIPDTHHNRLESVGIRVVDNLAPNKQAKIEEFKRMVKEVLS